MPTDKLGKYMEQLPQLEAERSLARIQEMAAAFGSLDDADQKRYVRQLQIVASGGKRPIAEKATAATLAQMKIPVETVGGGD